MLLGTWEVLFFPTFLKHWLPVLGELSTAFILPPEILDTRGTINCFFLVGGFNLPLWKMMEFVCWDYEISNTMEKYVPNHQPDDFSWDFWWDKMWNLDKKRDDSMILTNQLQHLRPWSSDVGASPGVTVYPQHLSCFSLYKRSLEIFLLDIHLTLRFLCLVSHPNLGRLSYNKCIYIYNYLSFFLPRISYQHIPSGLFNSLPWKITVFNR